MPASQTGIGITPAPRGGTGSKFYVRRPGGVVDRIPNDHVVKQDPPAPFVTAEPGAGVSKDVVEVAKALLGSAAGSRKPVLAGAR